MSKQYDLELISNETFKLKTNFFGIKNDIVSNEELKMSIYAFNNIGKPIFSETLDFDQISLLYNHLDQISIIKDSTKTITSKFIEANDNSLDLINNIKGINHQSLLNFFDKFKDDEEFNNLLDALTEEDDNGLNILEKLNSAKVISTWNKEIQNLYELLDIEMNGDIVKDIKEIEHLKLYSAKQPEKIFQKWINENIKWIFGVEYNKMHDARKIAIFSEADILMETVDGYLDLIELKRPKSDSEILKYDSSHNCYYPSPDLSKVIGQCLFYLVKMDDYKLNLEKEYGFKILRPRIKIIMGRSNNFTDEHNNALRMLNSNLGCLQIITYDSLLDYGKLMIDNYIVQK